MISYCSGAGLSNQVHVYKIRPETPTTRDLIGSFKTKNMAYGHSIGLTEDYAIVLELPILLSTVGMMEGKPMIKDMILQDDTTLIHVMKLSDGTTQTFDSKLWFISFHNGNAYIDDDGTLVLEAQIFENRDVNPFNLVSFDYLNDIGKITDSKLGSKYRKFSMNLEHGTLESKDYMSIENGDLDLPMINPKYQGVKNCFTYITENWGPTVIDEHYSFPIYKYDSCKEEIAGKWSQDQTTVQEANFVPNPNGTEEDDGIIMVQTYQFMKQKSFLTIIDPKTMDTLN